MTGVIPFSLYAFTTTRGTTLLFCSVSCVRLPSH